jgi:hypothetical protein
VTLFVFPYLFSSASAWFFSYLRLDYAALKEKQRKSCFFLFSLVSLSWLLVGPFLLLLLFFLLASVRCIHQYHHAGRCIPERKSWCATPVIVVPLFFIVALEGERDTDV